MCPRGSSGSFSWPCRCALPCLRGVLVVSCHVPEVPCPPQPCQHPHGPCRLPYPGDFSAGTASAVASRGAPSGLRSPCPASWAPQPWSRVRSARHLFWERCPYLRPAAQPRTRGTSCLPWGQPLGHPGRPKDGTGFLVLVPPPGAGGPPMLKGSSGFGGPCVTLEGHLRNGEGGAEAGPGPATPALRQPPQPSPSPNPPNSETPLSTIPEVFG